MANNAPSAKANASGLGLCGALFLLFVYLKLTKQITWAWVWVAAPLWGPVVAIGGGFMIVVGGYLVGSAIKSRFKRKRDLKRDRRS